MKPYKFVHRKMAHGVRLLEIGPVGLLWDGEDWAGLSMEYFGLGYGPRKQRWTVDTGFKQGYRLGWAYKRDKDWSLRGWLFFKLRDPSSAGPGEPTDAEVNEIAAELERRAGLPVVEHESYMLNLFGRGSERWWRPVVAQGVA